MIRITETEAVVIDPTGQAYIKTTTPEPGMGCGTGSDGAPCSPAYLCPACIDQLLTATCVACGRATPAELSRRLVVPSTAAARSLEVFCTRPDCLTYGSGAIAAGPAIGAQL